MIDDRVYIIAEAGVNHNGDEGMAFELVDVAVSAGADAIKFQTFKTENIVTQYAEKAEYQKGISDNVESQFSMLKKLEMSDSMHHQVVRYCKDKKIDFLSTAFDEESLLFLINTVGVSTLKVASGEITNGPLLYEHALSGKKIILSTGMSTIQEIRTALGVLAYGYSGGQQPSVQAFDQAYQSSQSRILLNDNVTLLHCTSEYPAPVADINLRAMDTLSEVFNLPVGYSDHSEGITIPIAAVARGAKVIEKHITLDRQLPGPDHKASLEPDELRNMVSSIRDVEVALGDGDKVPRGCELNTREVARKSIVAKTSIQRGDKFTSKNIQIKRPGIGISPMKYWGILGEESNKDYDVDDLI